MAGASKWDKFGRCLVNELENAETVWG